MKRIEWYVLGLFSVIITWLIFAENTPFWKAWFYGSWQIFAGLLIWEFVKMRKGNRYLLYSALLFDFQYLSYNVLLAFGILINKQTFAKVLIISIIVYLLTAFIYNVWHSRR